MPNDRPCGCAEHFHQLVFKFDLKQLSEEDLRDGRLAVCRCGLLLEREVRDQIKSMSDG